MPRIKVKRRGAIAVAIVVLLGIGGSAAWAATRGKSGSTTSTTTQVTVSSTTVSQSVSTTGTIEPAHEADLSFAVNGTVTSVPVAVGDKVTKGQALATVGTSELRSAVTLAEATLTAANEALSSADSGSSAVQVAAANAQVAQAKSNLAAAETSLANGTLRSTITGTVASVAISKGDTVGTSGTSGTSGGSGGTGSGSGSGTGTADTSSTTADIVVISTTSWVVDATVGSADLASVKKGLQAQITPTNAATRVFGTVASVGIVASSASSSSTSATFPVVIAVTGSPTGMYAGASATVSIIIKQVPNVLTVPTAALHSAGGKTFVYQTKSGKQVKTYVTVGTTYGPSTQITAGLASGDQVSVTTTTGAPGGSGTTNRNGTNRQGGFGGGGFGGGGGTGGTGGGGQGGGGTNNVNPSGAKG